MKQYHVGRQKDIEHDNYDIQNTKTLHVIKCRVINVIYFTKNKEHDYFI